jgi:hypothetical protein
LLAPVGKVWLTGKSLEGHGCLELGAGEDFAVLPAEAGACLAVAVSAGK